MGYYRIPLAANETQTIDVPGTLILVDSIEGAAGVDITPIRNGTPQRTMPGRKIAFKYRVAYDAVQLRAPANCTVSIFLTTDDVSLGFADGAQVNVLGTVAVANSPDQRVPVDLAGGTVTVSASNVGINNTPENPVPVAVKNDDTNPLVVRQQPLATLVDHVAATINAGAAQLLVSDPTFKRLRVRNASAAAIIAIGGTSVSIANAAILLQPGDMWCEDDAAGAAWYAVSDVGGADVRVMGVK